MTEGAGVISGVDGSLIIFTQVIGKMFWRFFVRFLNQFLFIFFSSVIIFFCKYRKLNKGYYVINLDFLKFFCLLYLCKEIIFIILILIYLVLKIVLDFNKYFWNKVQNERGCQLNILRKESFILVCSLKLYLVRVCFFDCRVVFWVCLMEVIIQGGRKCQRLNVFFL